MRLNLYDANVTGTVLTTAGTVQFTTLTFSSEHLFLIDLQPEDGEAEAFCDRIQQACTNYEDPYLAPSLAIGLVYRTNVEESFDKCYSDAEYEMCYNKLDVKHADGYKERLEHGLK